jgi:hypothetical protein
MKNIRKKTNTRKKRIIVNIRRGARTLGED